MPDWTGNASAVWTQPVWASDKLIAEIDYSYVGRSFSANNIAAPTFTTRERPSYELVDARIALKHGDWEVAVVGKNLTNEHADLADSRSIAAETPWPPATPRESASDHRARIAGAFLAPLLNTPRGAPRRRRMRAR